MISAVVLLAVLSTAQLPSPDPHPGYPTERRWIHCVDREAGGNRWVWGWMDGSRCRFWEAEQADAITRYPRPSRPDQSGDLLTGVLPDEMRKDTKQRRASDHQAEAFLDDLIQQNPPHNHQAGQPCPDGGSCPVRPKKPKPDDTLKPHMPTVPVKVNWNLRPQYIVPAIVVIAIIVALWMGRDRNV